MSEVQIFQEITTDEILTQLEAEAEKYTGLYVDMHESEGRKYVKAQASKIGDMLKALDRARIDKSKSYKAMVESEAKSIRERLERANEPYTLLINEYTAERKRFLEVEKAKKQAIIDAEQLEIDHEFALLMNDKWDSEKVQREADRLAELKRIQDEAEAKAKQDLINQQNAAAEAERIRKLELAANEAHVKSVNKSVLDVYLSAGFPQELAERAVKLLVRSQLPNTIFSY